MLSFFTGKLLETVDSAYNGTIEVYQQLGQTKIVASGLLQSGGIIEQLWKKPLKKIHKSGAKIQHVLILGLGGGTLSGLIAKIWPQANITGIEIDKEMIRLGKKYLGLGAILNLTITQADAFDFVKSQHLSNQYDLVLVDLFCGSHNHEKIASLAFYQALHNLLRIKGKIILNQLFYGKHTISAEKAIKTIEKKYHHISLIRNMSNLFVVFS